MKRKFLAKITRSTRSSLTRSLLRFSISSEENKNVRISLKPFAYDQLVLTVEELNFFGLVAARFKPC